MEWIESEVVMFTLSVLVQVIGICGVLFARWNGARRRQRRYDLLALCCVATVGFLSLMLIKASSECWLAFAMTMPLMAVAATLDVSKSHGPRGF